MKLSLTLSALLTLPLVAAAQSSGRYEQFTKKFANAPDQAKVETATYLGGAGVEWLVGGGFQPDGTVVAVGVALGPKLDLGGVKEKVLGTDLPAPAAPEPRQQKDNKGKLLTDKLGNPKFEAFGWKHENATAFVARLSPDLKTVLSVSRFPWTVAGATSSCVDSQGNVYIAGPATVKLHSLGLVEAVPTVDNGAKSGPVSLTYLAKLNPKADAVLWIKTFAGPSSSPTVRILAGDKVQFTGPDLRVFDAAGKIERTTVVPGGLIGHVAVNPVDGTYVRGGEHHWPTGREPYRDPQLNVYRPNGKHLYELYNWDGPFVGIDNLRLVSDSAIRMTRFDDDGNLIIYAWSDGGNSVMYREPNDIRTMSKKMNGLGMSAYGAGVLSCAYVIKIETKNYKVSGGTLWLAFTNANKPNSIWINSMGFAADGSIAFAGHSAWGLIQTGNAIGKSEPTGTYVALLNKDCDSLRFSSTMPACGRTDVAEGQKWGYAAGSVKGRPKMLYFAGAAENEEVSGATLPAPTVNPVQSRYGGGHVDGYLLLLDLGKN